jgi:menaquinone-dependent protoporphyrinogen oxidase
MYDVAVFYATTEGHTRRIGERLVRVLREHGLSSEVFEISSAGAQGFDWSRAQAAVLAASLHMGKHQAAAGAFARARRAELSAIPSLFVSVSLSAVSKNESERQAARRIADQFVAAAGWEPWRVATVGGRLAYTQYGFLTRWLMKQISKKEGGPTDTSRDHDLTDWPAVEALGRDLALEVRRLARRPEALATVG